MLANVGIYLILHRPEHIMCSKFEDLIPVSSLYRSTVPSFKQNKLI